MLLVLDEKHKADLALLRELDVAVLAEFCRIAISFIKNGPNKKLFTGAAQTLGVTVDQVESCVEGLTYLFTESSRAKIPELDFVDSLIILQFPKEVNELLKQHYLENRDDIRHIISGLTVELPHYKNLEWRLDLQMASRTAHRQISPVYTLRFEIEDEHGTHKECLQADYVNMKKLCTELERALKEAQSGHARRIMRNIK